MDRIIAPIKPGESGPAVANLQDALLALLEKTIIHALSSPDRPTEEEVKRIAEGLKDERVKSQFGASTGQLVVYFQIQQGLGDNLRNVGVEEKTADKLNELLEELGLLDLPEPKPEPVLDNFVVRGTVTTSDGQPLSGAVVRAFDRDLRKRPMVGEGETDELGQYIIRYTSSQFAFGDLPSAKAPSLIVRAFFDDQQIGEDVTLPRPIRDEVVDFRVPTPELSEWERVGTSVLPLLREQGEGHEALPPWKLNDTDLNFLVEETELERELIRLWALAFVLGQNAASLTRASKADQRHAVAIHAFPERGIFDGQLTFAIFYGWWRLGLPAELSALWETSSETLITTLKAAIEQRVVPSKVGGDLDGISARIEQFKLDRVGVLPPTLTTPSLGDVLDTIPGGLPSDRKVLVTAVLQDKSNPEIPLSEKLRKAGLKNKDVAAVERTLAFQSFSENFLPLIKTLQNEEEINSLRDLALTTNEETLTRKIIHNKAYPDGETAEAFAGRLYRKLFQAEPTAMLLKMLDDHKATPLEDETVRTNVARFISNLPETFNIKTNSVYEAFKNENAFKGIAPELHENIKSEIKSLQRVAALSPVPEVLPVLMKSNVTSALMVSEMPENQFVQAISKQLGTNGEPLARQVHANAVNASIRNEQALIALREVQQGTGIAMVDKAMRSGFGENNVNDALEKNNLSWDSLFGDSDLCECGECTSVYSAANYFVELLQYLRNNNLDPNATGPLAISVDPKDISKTPLQKLFDRRPDLKCLELTCPNTNTKLPYVDLVNEVMESYVAFHKTLAFNVNEDETSEELLAQPQHTEYQAYEQLRNAVYPFSLPYHQPIDAARIYLNSLGTSRHELIDTFRSARNKKYLVEPLAGAKNSTPLATMSPALMRRLDRLYEIYLDRAADAEYLSLTQEEYVILTKEAFVSKQYWDEQLSQAHTPEEYLEKIGSRPVHEYYGYASESEMLSADESQQQGLTFVKHQFLKRTGLQYLELVELLKTQSLNPNVPRDEALGIMERIQFSYRYLQTLVNNTPGISEEDKYRRVIQAIGVITNPQALSLLDQFLGLADPCKAKDEASPLSEAQVKEWVGGSFERVGKIIVLDNGAKCIDGKLFIRRDKPIDTGFKIENCQIINGATGAVLGSVDKTTGNVTLNEGQQSGDWSSILFVGNKGEKGTFLNVLGKIYLVTAPAVETCDLEPVRLIHLDGTPLTVEEYDHIHRFTRLWRKLGWTIRETDDALAGLGTASNFDLSTRFLHQLVAVKKLYERSGLELSKLLTFWTNISTLGTGSLYKRLFLARNVVGADNVFPADGNGRYLADPTLQILDHAPVLMAALNLRANDIAAIMKQEAITTLTIENISKLYRYRLLSRMLGLGIADFISVLPLFANPFASPDATLSFLDQWKRIEDAGFDYRQLNYIIEGHDDPRKPMALTKKASLQLAKTLYDGLNAIEEAHPDVKAVSATIATTELVKQKASLLYDQVAVDNIIGVLEGTNVYSANSPADVKDLLRPLTVSPPATTQDYEYLQLDNYPLLKGKIKYDRRAGSLQIAGSSQVVGSLQVKGILTELEEKGSSLFWVDDILNTSSLVKKLKDPSSDPATQDVSEYLWDTFSAQGEDTLSDSASTVEQQQGALVLELNTLIQSGSMAADFSGVTLSVVTNDLIAQNPTGDDLIRLNRLLLEDTYPLEIAKNTRIGFKTIRENLLPSLSLQNSVESIENQHSKSFDETFGAHFASFKSDFLAGDSNDLPVDPATTADNNTAPLKRAKFLEIFLPYLRKELTRRFIVTTLSSQTALSNDVTELLITRILETKTSTTGAAEPIYSLFSNIKNTAIPGSSNWNGYLIPSTEGQYTFIVKGSSASPDLSLEGNPISFVEQANSVDEWWSVPQKLQAGKLYNLVLTGTNPDSLYWKTATSAITPIPSPSLLPDHAEDKTRLAFARLQRAALLISGFSLSADEIQYLSDHGSDFGQFNFNEVKLEQFLRLEAYTRLRNSLAAAKINIFEFLSWTLDETHSATELSKTIEELTGWKQDWVEQLAHELHFDLQGPKSFHSEINLLKLHDALVVAQKIGVNIDLLFDWANPNSDFDECRRIAESIQRAIRAQYDREESEKAMKPLSDKLRENQKKSLIAYLLVQPDVMKWGVTDADGLFEYFLIDVQMDACMETSRIVQAISSVQLFVQRCFLGLERKHSNIPPEMLDRGRWEWMQRYRVWEANRKVFLYPENWIESNLRDDKSSFFKELESELLQKDIDKQNVEDALKAYLYKVDEVANMEVVGLYIEKSMVPGQNFERGEKLHVFSRTRNAPYSFYYRHLDILAGNWYPWEKMQVDIPSYDREDVTEVTKVPATNPATYRSNPNFKRVIGNGCYLTPVVWNDRLLIFFPQFMRKTKPNDDVADSKSIADLSEESTSSSRPIEYWEIKMAWSEYRNGKWTQKQLSKDAIYDVPPPTGFWKAFNDDQKAKARVKTTLKEKTAANASYVRERAKLLVLYAKNYQNPVTITLSELQIVDSNNGITSYSIDVKATNVGDGKTQSFGRNFDTSHPFIKAYEKSREADQAFLDAVSTANIAATVLGNATLPPPTGDISKYVFMPVLSDAGSLLGIKVNYAQDVNGVNQHQQKGIFEFDGSKITTAATATYTYSRSLNAVDTFNHYSANIISLQENDFTSHLFNDGGATMYTLEPLNDAYTISFHHSDARKLLGTINSQQLGSFFKFYIDHVPPDKDDVFGGYDDDTDTLTPNIYNELKRPYSIYNWELFFHTPMMLADALSKAQQFEEAMKWYHYVFNPIAAGTPDDPLWQFNPFRETDAKRILDHIFNRLKPNQSDPEINEWRSNPFQPHVVARSRPVAYMKWVVMKYVDNLVAWGDYLFRQDTIESINQATQLYVLAGHILGPRPQMIPKRGKIRPQTYLSLLSKWDAFSNAMVELELALPFSNQAPLPIGTSSGVVGLANVFGFASTTYFCIPNNPNLMGYWDTIADRLFKIRHCENIEGVFRKLPLFEPPIDPAILVKAAAQGLSIASVLNDLNTPMPNYRFYYLLQKALELCGELKTMGSAMLSAIEKRDNETISLIRARHESGMLNLVKEIKKQQLEEAQKALEGLRQNRKSPEHRMKYYLQLVGEDVDQLPGLDSEFVEIANTIEKPIDESGLKLIKYEKEDMDKAHEAADWQLAIGGTETLAGILNIIPVFAADVKPFGMGAGGSFGGSNLGSAVSAVARGMQTFSTNLTFQSSNAARKGGFLRSLQERVMQANAAGYEIKQIDKQILAQQIRIGIATLEIANHQKQIDNAQEIEEFLRNKYSSEELYSWMKGSLSALYRQVYSLAFDLAKKAEKVFRFERGLTSSTFIQGGYWDAGYNGLLAGEQLYVGLKQLEAAYHENRGYDYEITKHVSLRQTNPMAILQLKETGKCEFSLPEVLLDIDYPGHYKRRIKSVSITIPCVAGPYVGLNGTLRLLENKFRNSAIATPYPEKTEEADERFQSYIIPINAIAASSGQNDSGMFELNFRDERYLPFEGAGAISKWRFELPTSLRQFDYNTIADVVVHVRYTSVEGGASLKMEAERSVANYISNAEQVSREEGLFAILDLKHDFPTQWHQLFNQNQQTANWEINHSHFPYLFNGRDLDITGTKIYLKPKANIVITPRSTDMTLNGESINHWNAAQDSPLTEGTVDLTGSPIRTWTIDRGSKLLMGNQIDDLLILIKYRVRRVLSA